MAPNGHLSPLQGCRVRVYIRLLSVQIVSDESEELAPKHLAGLIFAIGLVMVMGDLGFGWMLMLLGGGGWFWLGDASFEDLGGTSEDEGPSMSAVPSASPMAPTAATPKPASGTTGGRSAPLAPIIEEASVPAEYQRLLEALRSDSRRTGSIDEAVANLDLEELRSAAGALGLESEMRSGTKASILQAMMETPAGADLRSAGVTAATVAGVSAVGAATLGAVGIGALGVRARAKAQKRVEEEVHRRVRARLANAQIPDEATIQRMLGDASPGLMGAITPARSAMTSLLNESGLTPQELLDYGDSDGDGVIDDVELMAIFETMTGEAIHPELMAFVTASLGLSSGDVISLERMERIYAQLGVEIQEPITLPEGEGDAKAPEVDPEIERLTARIEALETENARLRTELEGLGASADPLALTPAPKEASAEFVSKLEALSEARLGMDRNAILATMDGQVVTLTIEVIRTERTFGAAGPMRDGITVVGDVDGTTATVGVRFPASERDALEDLASEDVLTISGSFAEWKHGLARATIDGVMHQVGGGDSER